MKKRLLKLVLCLFIGFSIASCEEAEITPVTEEIVESKGKSSIDSDGSRAADISIVVNGVPLTWPANAEPAIRNNRSMVYFATIFQRLGFSVKWFREDPNPTHQNKVGKQYVRAYNGTTGVFIELWVGLAEARVNGVTKYALVAPYNNVGRIMVHAGFIGDHAGVTTEWDNESRSVQMYYYDENDYGFYFYDAQDERSGDPTADAVGNRKFVAGKTLDRRFFDPNKPTIIYVHGFQPGGAVNQTRETFLMNYGGENTNVHNVWKNAPNGGWNVAIFHWVNMADDRQIAARPWASEAKIYDANNTVNGSGNGMRWRKSDGTYVTGPGQSLRAIFASQFGQIFNNPNYRGAEIRIVGNSLGGNLAIAASHHLLQSNSRRMPSRITLMDPYWSLSDRSTHFGYGQSSAETFAGYAAGQLANPSGSNIVIEYFRTSRAWARGFFKKCR